ncbi:MAG: hypothetical protein Q7N50_14545 [Armatimonadota bacterium]|nr:hypothetical protein [Armatimonadota bacterium]
MKSIKVCKVLALIILSAVLLAGCGRTPKREAATSKAQKLQDIKKIAKALTNTAKLQVESKGVKELSWQSNGSYIMRASAKSLTADERSLTAQLSGARAVLYKNGKEAMSVSARLIEVDGKAEKLTARNGATAKSLVRDVSARVGNLTWTHKDHRIIGEGAVTVASGAGSLSGDRFVGDTELKQIRVYARNGGRASLSAAALE